MQTKLPHSTCSHILDQLIVQGYVILEGIEKDYWEAIDKYLGKSCEKKIGDVDKALQESAKQTLSEEEIELFMSRAVEWVNDSASKLKDVFIHQTPMLKFVNLEYEESGVSSVWKDYERWQRIFLLMTCRIDLLTEWYEYFGRGNSHKVTYEASKQELWFNGISMRLKAGGHRDRLCNYVFKVKQGQKMEFCDIADAIWKSDKEAQGDYQAKDHFKQIRDLVKDINKRAKREFRINFPILSYEGVLLWINAAPLQFEKV